MHNSLTYAELESRLAAARVELGAAEIDGLLCALLCGNRKGARSLFLAEILSEGDVNDLLLGECRRSLDELYDRALAGVTDPQMGFEPLLPGDEMPLTDRALALRDWCAGFLYGFGLSDARQMETLGDGVREVLQDLSEISRLDTAELADAGDEDEEALMQLTEFLRVAVMNIYDDLEAEGVDQA
ncbi:MAG: UPF0149 family protein [Gammaproteobacteria bacterium]|nr:UPF0149 family protein [Gammaproteobacteria bacterium]